MFSGIITQIGLIKQLMKTPAGLKLWIRACYPQLVIGESIAHDGVCLTVVEIQGDCYRVDVSPETLRLTNIAHYKQNTPVNLERSLRMSDRNSGHFVQGHIDQCVSLVNKMRQDQYLAYTFAGVRPENRALLVKKGSIAINGVSLTVNHVNDDGFSVMLIPHTLQHTNLRFLQNGSQVNVEYDILNRIIASQLNHSMRDPVDEPSIF